MDSSTANFDEKKVNEHCKNPAPCSKIPTLAKEFMKALPITDKVQEGNQLSFVQREVNYRIGSFCQRLETTPSAATRNPKLKSAISICTGGS